MTPREVYFVWAPESAERTWMLASAVDVAVREAVALFLCAPTGTQFRKVCISAQLPAPMQPEQWALVYPPSEGLYAPLRRSFLDGRSERMMDLVSASQVKQASPTERVPLLHPAIYDVVVRRLRNVPELGYHDQPCLVITDVELKPPEGWRYLFSDDCGNGMVMSTETMDPDYWCERGTNRMATIRKRLRATCCSNLGDIYGVPTCENPRCFFMGPLSSVTLLDEMVGIGSEHRDSVLGELVHRRFSTIDSASQSDDIIVEEPVVSCPAMPEEA